MLRVFKRRLWLLGKTILFSRPVIGWEDSWIFRKPQNIFWIFAISHRRKSSQECGAPLNMWRSDAQIFQRGYRTEETHWHRQLLRQIFVFAAARRPVDRLMVLLSILRMVELDACLFTCLYSYRRLSSWWLSLDCGTGDSYNLVMRCAVSTENNNLSRENDPKSFLP